MFVFVIPGRVPGPSLEKATRRPNECGASDSLGGDDETRDRSFDTWPLPKRLSVRLQTSAERFVTQTDLEERLRLAERLQVRAIPVIIPPRVCFSEGQNAFHSQTRSTILTQTPSRLKPNTSKGTIDTSPQPACVTR